VGEIKAKIDDLVAFMEEFGLDSAKMAGEDWSVEFSRDVPSGPVVTVSEPSALAPKPERARTPKGQAPTGTPVNSPTTGIYYSSPNPGAPSFVKVGDTVEAGQVIGLIEAMKVFNEITATVSGTVQRVVAQNGQLVQPGDPLIYIG
jgi:acetyl-CoA carboxylase biotin carboxyl carrier protein